jgi:hypothetical protein
MTVSRMLRSSVQLTLAVGIFATLGSVRAADPDPAVMAFQLPDQIKWVESPSGSANAILAGDPTKPGIYVELTKWKAGHMSRPHFHPNDRYIYVISGTWWVGWGSKYDPASTKPLPAGSYVRHFGKQIHYDGAKEGDTILEIVGEGPATSTPAEKK